jgi:hypothetical protein
MRVKGQGMVRAIFSPPKLTSTYLNKYNNNKTEFGVDNKIISINQNIL